MCFSTFLPEALEGGPRTSAVASVCHEVKPEAAAGAQMLERQVALAAAAPLHLQATMPTLNSIWQSIADRLMVTHTLRTSGPSYQSKLR